MLPGRHALIIVRQPKGQLISIRSQSELYGTASTRELKVWNACDDVQDYVTVYDGYTTRDPVILKFCGGGEAVPEAISSGHELLVEFSTSPYGTFLHPPPMQSLHGFQLEVEVRTQVIRFLFRYDDWFKFDLDYVKSKTSIHSLSLSLVRVV